MLRSVCCCGGCTRARTGIDTAGAYLGCWCWSWSWSWLMPHAACMGVHTSPSRRWCASRTCRSAV